MNYFVWRIMFLLCCFYGTGGTIGGLVITMMGIFGTDGSTAWGGVFLFVTGVVMALISMGWMMNNEASNNAKLPGTVPYKDRNVHKLGQYKELG